MIQTKQRNSFAVQKAKEAKSKAILNFLEGKLFGWDLVKMMGFDSPDQFDKRGMNRLQYWGKEESCLKFHYEHSDSFTEVILLNTRSFELSYERLK